MPIPLPNGYTPPPPPPPVPTPDRLWIRSLTITLPDANTYSVRATPCLGTATQLLNESLPEISSPNLGAELTAAPDSQAKADALAALQRLAADIPTVFAFLHSLRG